MEHDNESRRGRRRRLTRRVSARRCARHLRWHHPDGAADCACAQATTYFADQLSPCPAGRKRLRGQPRLGVCCGDGNRLRIYRLRAEGRELARLILHQNVDGDEDIAAVLSHGRVREW